MTRKEAEEQILHHLDEIRKIHLSYNPEGRNLFIICARDFINAENDFSLGGRDYDHPISVNKWIEEDQKK